MIFFLRDERILAALRYLSVRFHRISLFLLQISGLNWFCLHCYYVGYLSRSSFPQLSLLSVIQVEEVLRSSWIVTVMTALLIGVVADESTVWPVQL